MNAFIREGYKASQAIERVDFGGIMVTKLTIAGEYETEGPSLHMELKRKLDRRKSSNEARAVGVIMRADTKTGDHGLPLKALTLEAVPQDTKEIDVAVLGYSVMVEGKTIEV